MTKTREEVLDKHYPKERTVFRDAIMVAMSEYAAERVTRFAAMHSIADKQKNEEIMSLKRELKISERRGVWRSVLLVIGVAALFAIIEVLL